MHAVIRKYTFDPSHYEEIDRKVKDEFTPLLQKSPGFISHFWLDSGHGEGVSLSVFEDAAGADNSVHLASDYVREHLAHLMGTPEVVRGEVKAHVGVK